MNSDLCQHPDCPREVKLRPGRYRRWDALTATKKGWFGDTQGNWWCPEHIPEWVPQWREDRRREERYEICLDPDFGDEE